ncbi:hypothetical protein BCR35DRAFT_25076 [Leucosporidium creatinivorum]|uniref:Secreted protein n=1 Tax=Leucosporidium creatinivorum TaxID=106004 RepID=A0A1Y2CT43_9BASI|nr:hypothetical protein BCR35DRAFT_25076 [Leucosporidium creatinivorum]
MRLWNFFLCLLFIDARRTATGSGFNDSARTLGRATERNAISFLLSGSNLPFSLFSKTKALQLLQRTARTRSSAHPPLYLDLLPRCDASIN